MQESMFLLKGDTPPKTNMEPENSPLEKEKHRPKPSILWVPAFGGVYGKCPTWHQTSLPSSRIIAITSWICNIGPQNNPF